MSVSTKSKTFEFWSISLWEGIIVFIIFIILFHLPMFYTSELQKWWGIVIRLYLPMVVLCTLGYVKLRSRKLIIETNSKQRQFIYTRKNKQLLTEFEKVEELQDVIGSNTKKEKIDLVPLSINLLIDVVPFIIIPLAILYLIAIFTDNLHWFDFLKSLL